MLLKCRPQGKQEGIFDLVQVFRAKVVDVADEALTLSGRGSGQTCCPGAGAEALRHS